MELTKGRVLAGEGAGKDRLFTKHGRTWRVRTVKETALPTFAITRDGEPTAPMGAGYTITVVGIDDAGEVERGRDGAPLPLATVGMPIDADALAVEGFDLTRKHLEVVHAAVDAAAVRRTNMQALNLFDDAFVTMPEELGAAPVDEAAQRASDEAMILEDLRQRDEASRTPDIDQPDMEAV